MSTWAPTQDMHAHSTFSDGTGTIEENVREAEARGLRELTCIDHVRADTDWLPAYVAEVRRVRATTALTLHCGIEAKLLDSAGHLDLPPWVDGVEVVYAADHQVPLADGPHHPREVRDAIADGTLTADEVLASLLTSTANALRRHDVPIVIAHLFSVLPKLDLRAEDVAPELLAELAEATAATGNRIEVNERYATPSAAALRPFLERGVPLLLSTDSHRSDTIGRYQHGRAVLDALADLAPPAAR